MTARPNAPDLRALDDKYEVVGELRARKDAQQFLAKRKSDGADVLITVISAAGGGENNALAHLASDVNLLTGLRHPGLLQTLDGRWLGTDAFAVVTQRVSGVSLDEVLSSGERLTNPRIAAILEQVRGVIDWARNNGVVHRGVTVDTLYVERDTQRLCTTLTVTPIPLEGMPDQCSDAQMIGALAWTLLTGEPYGGEESQRQLADMRPDLSTRLIAETEAMARCSADGTIPDLDTMIAVIATGDAWQSSESELARIEAEHTDAMRQGREQFESEKATTQQQLADETERIAAERGEFERQRQAEIDRLAADRAEWERTTAQERAEYDRTTAQEREELEDRAAEQQQQLTSLRDELEARRMEIEQLDTEVSSKHAELTAGLADMETRRIEVEQYLYEEQQRVDDERDRLAEERARLAATVADAPIADREVAIDSRDDAESDDDEDDDEGRATPMARAVPELEPLPSIAPLAPIQPIAPLPPVPPLGSLKSPRIPPADSASEATESDAEQMEDRPAPTARPDHADANESASAANAMRSSWIKPAAIAGAIVVLILLIFGISRIHHGATPTRVGSVAAAKPTPRATPSTMPVQGGVTSTAGGTLAPGLATISTDSSALSGATSATSATSTSANEASVNTGAPGAAPASSSSERAPKRVSVPSSAASREAERAREKAAVSAMQHDPGTAGEPDAYYGPPTTSGTSSVVPVRHDTIMRVDTAAARPTVLPPPAILRPDTMLRARPPVLMPRPDTMMVHPRPDTLVRPDTSSLASARPPALE